MKLLRGVRHVPAIFAGGTVATIGNFDGVHSGHQSLLAKLKAESIKRKLPLVVVLFEPQPGEFFRGKQAPARLSSLREKLAILKQCQVDYVYCLRFNTRFASMPAEDFARFWLFDILKVNYLLVGSDFRFGQKRTGDLELLCRLAMDYNAQVETCPDFAIASGRVSSTKIRTLLAEDKLEQAANLLGRTYSLCGRVVRGAGLGRQWGIPTANVAIRRLALPFTGVYRVRIHLAKGEVHNGVANIGCRPTVDGSKNVLEVHILNFNRSLYGEMIQVSFLEKLRDEKKFSSVDELIAQIRQDIASAKAKLQLNMVAE
ncbi:bifunctional riboflavin kinase/FAD synthetase [Legionella dresdenensis]|uniref:Riboflavin biosynthesis protein n=1 Tax=Legionella dresdenensis TaxID=450200 RepID=A0ABV8CE09_9GAMM